MGRLDLSKHNLKCSKCRLHHLPVDLSEERRYQVLEPSGVNAKSDFVQHRTILHVLSVDSANYLRASWELRIYMVFQTNGVYKQDLKRRTRSTRLDLLKHNWD